MKFLKIALGTRLFEQASNTILSLVQFSRNFAFLLWQKDALGTRLAFNSESAVLSYLNLYSWVPELKIAKYYSNLFSIK